MKEKFKDKLSAEFTQRQHMNAPDFEVFYYNDLNPSHIVTHYHEHYEFYFFLEGEVNYSIANSPHVLQYGDFLLIPPLIDHRPVFYEDNSTYRRIVLWINKNYFEYLLSLSTEFSYAFYYAADNQKYHYRPDLIIAQSIQGQLLNLIEEVNSANPFSKLNSNVLIASFIVNINKITYNMQNKVNPAYENALYLNICDYINNHLNENLSLDALSSFFYVSKYHISHIFKDNMGISLHQYILKKRLQACKNGILSGTAFSRVYPEYGFNDYTSFYRAFKKEFGMSPTEYALQNGSTIYTEK